MNFEDLMLGVCAACMLCGIIIIGCQIRLNDDGQETFYYTIGSIFLIMGGYGIWRINKDREIAKRCNV